MLNLFFSNRHEVLTAALLRDLQGPFADPFTPVSVIVPKSSIRRRLELDWAQDQGICAHVQFDYLATWIWGQLQKVAKAAPDQPFAPEKICWRIFEILADDDFTDRHPRLSGYILKSGKDPLMRLELAQRLALLFDQYITYRQSWIKAWTLTDDVPSATPGEVHADQDWQVALWRRLVKDLQIDVDHPRESFFRALENETQEMLALGLPERVAVFCLTDIPPLYLSLLQGFSRVMEIHLYVLNPCRHFWNEITQVKRLRRLQAEGKDAYHEVGNPLLAAWGGQTQALMQQLSDLADGSVLEKSLYLPSQENHPASLLERVQCDLLDLLDPEMEEPYLWQPDDQSLQIHVCHSLTRQLEVLHDRLLDLFEHDPELETSDVLVVMPGLEKAAPLIRQVFDTAPRPRRIPYQLTGLSTSRTNRVAEGLLYLIKLLSSRFKASEVFEFLRKPLVTQRYHLNPQDLDQIHQWIREAGIHFGLDHKDRKALSLGGGDSGTFAEGLDRLFLAYAASGIDLPFAGFLPAGWVEGTSAPALGALDQFVADLEEASSLSKIPTTGEEWSSRIKIWMERFFEISSDNLAEWREVCVALEALQTLWKEADLSERLTLVVVEKAMVDRFDSSQRGAVPEGRVTFAGLGPMRGLPYRVICILGLEDTVFPLVRSADEFDLMAAGPTVLGDRKRSRDDRNLFLDHLLAAGEVLHLSYTGRSIRDDSELTPSIVLSELTEYLVQRTGISGSPWIIRHPLKAFSQEYFKSEPIAHPSRLFSYVREYAEALNGQDLRANKISDAQQSFLEAGDPEDLTFSELQPFFVGPLPSRGSPPFEVTVTDLIRFFQNPCQYFLERRLGLSLKKAESELEDDELFLPRWESRSRLLEKVMQCTRPRREDPDALKSITEASSVYPMGAMGRLMLEEELLEVQRFTRRVEKATIGEALLPISGSYAFRIDGEEWVLKGTLCDLRAQGQVIFRYADLQPHDVIRGWIQHLFLHRVSPAGVLMRTRWISRGGGYELSPLEEVMDLFGDLLSLYREGLQKPLHFFPKSAWAYIRSDGDAKSALKAALQVWSSRYGTYGEGLNPAYRLALRGLGDPLNQEFQSVSCRVMAPILQSFKNLDASGESHG